jgi:hypothetical protein
MAVARVYPCARIDSIIADASGAASSNSSFVWAGCDFLLAM